MKRNWIYVTLAIAVLAFAGLVYAQQQGYIGFDQGRRVMTVRSGGKVDVQSGGTLEVDSGATCTIDTAVIGTLTATSFTGARATQVIRQITAATDTAYASGTLKVSGDAFYARPLAQKSTLLLESAVAGAWFDVFVADADSLLITTASGDSILTSAGVAWKTTSSVAGTVRMKALDTTRWLMESTVGTWISY